MEEDITLLLKNCEESQYANLDKLTFAEELRIHQDQTVFAFEYGEEVSRRTRERICSTENKYKERRKPVEETPVCKDAPQSDYEVSNPVLFSANVLKFHETFRVLLVVQAPLKLITRHPIQTNTLLFTVRARNVLTR